MLKGVQRHQRRRRWRRREGGGSSATRGICPTGAWIARGSCRWREPAAAKGPARSPPTTRTPPRWGSRRPGWRCGRSRGQARSRLAGHHRARLPGQDQRHRHPRRSPAGPRRGRGRRRRRRAQFGRGRAAQRPAGIGDGAGGRQPICVPAAGQQPTRRPAGTGRPPSWSGRTTDGPVLGGTRGLGQRHRGVSRPLAAAGRRALEDLGGALRRGQVRRARRAGLGDGAEGRRASSADAVDHLIVAGPHGRAVGALSQALGRVGRRAWPTTWPPPSARPARPIPPCCSPPCSSGWPRPVIALVSLADGADVLLFRTTAGAWPASRPASPVAAQLARAAP